MMRGSGDIAALIARAVRDEVRAALAAQNRESVGVVKRVGGELMLQSPSGQLAPFLTTVSVNDGDEVRYRVDSHQAVVTGNLGSPAVDALAIERIAGAVTCIEQTGEGLLISNKKDGAYTGARTLYGASSIMLLDAAGNPMAVYAVDGISLGECEIKVLEGYGLNIYSADGPILISSREFANGASSLIPRQPYLSADSQRAEMGAEYPLTDAEGIYGKGVNSVAVDTDGVHLNGKVYINGEEVRL